MLRDCSRILVVGGDPRWREGVVDALQSGNLEAHAARTTFEACADGTLTVEAAIVSINTEQEGPAVDDVATLARRFPDARVVLMGCRGRRGVMRTAYRAGAWDCIDGVNDTSELIRSLREETPSTKPAEAHRSTVEGLSGTSIKSADQHSAFLNRLAALRRDCQHGGGRVTIGLFDLDEFHSCNERHSPSVGDSVLRWFERTLHQACRPTDLAFRDHGDEYVVLLPEADEEVARQLAERCRQGMQSSPFTWDGRAQEMTVSVGVVESSPGCVETEHQLLQRARIAVTQAKQLGGNATISWLELLQAPLTRVRRQPLTVNDVSHWMARVREQVRSTQHESTQALVAAIDARDPYTRLHSLTVSLYADWIGRKIGLPVQMLDALRAASLLHDVGKIGVPDAILTKPGPLTEEEFAVVRRHPEIALEILGNVSFLNDERPLILHHHERYDGAGYPAGLSGDRIPIGARILAVADALDTMFTPRTYKKAYDITRVRHEMAAGRGRQFDPDVTDVTLRALDEEPDLFAGAASAQTG